MCTIVGEISNTQIDNAKEIGVVTPMYNAIKYSDNCSKTSGSSWHKNEPNTAINSESFIFISR